MTPLGLKSYKEFWPYYVMEHTHYLNRQLHAVGTALTFVFLGLGIFKSDPLWLVGMPLSGYGLAWIGHFFVQKNKPATFNYPIWSLIGDYHMFILICMGKMREELIKSARLTGNTTKDNVHVS